MATLNNLLTDGEMRSLYDLIQSYYNALVYNTIRTKGFLTEDEIDDMVKLGLIDDTLRNPLLDAYKFGKIQHIIGQEAARRMTYGQFKRYLASNPMPLSTAEAAAIRSVNKVASKYLAGNLSSKVKSDVADIINNANRSMIADAIRTELPKNIEKRETILKLASQIKKQIGAYSDDFQKIAHTEKHNAMQAGVATEMYNIDRDIRVVKIPAPDACKYCIKLFTKPDGSLRVFLLKDIVNNSNVGRSKSNWLPTVDAVHPWCGCELARIPKGYWFNPKTRFVERLVKSFGKLNKDGTYSYEHSMRGEPLNPDKEKNLQVMDNVLKGIALSQKFIGAPSEH